MITEKNAKLAKEMQDKENLLFANEIVIEELKAKNKMLSKENTKLTKANEKCKCKKQKKEFEKLKFEPAGLKYGYERREQKCFTV